MRTAGSLLALLVLLAGPTRAGVYAYAEDPNYSPAIIVHPNQYTGTGGAVTIGICVHPAAQLVISQDVEYAVRVWNERIAKTRNCEGLCFSPEGASPSPPVYSYVVNTPIHELGHGALGLGHVNAVVPPASHLDFTATKNWDNITAGVDGVRGSKDDVVTPLPGALMIHWYRLADNNPIVVDSTVINTNTYSRAFSLLPSGSSWSASANSRVGNLLGAPGTQSVMVSVQPLNSVTKRLTGDDRNTVSFAEKGILPQPTSPGDDYTYSLAIVPDCANAQVEVKFERFHTPPNPPVATLGDSNPAVTPLPGGSGNHYRLGTMGSDPRVIVRVNSEPAFHIPPDPDIPIFLTYAVFLDDFETGSAGAWSDIVP